MTKTLKGATQEWARLIEQEKKYEISLIETRRLKGLIIKLILSKLEEIE